MGRAVCGDVKTDEHHSRKEDFVTAFRETLGSVGRAQNVIARKAGVGQSSISCYNTGKRVPEQASLERIYKVLEAEARRCGSTLPHSLAQLHGLREAAKIESIAPVTAAAWTSGTDSALTGAIPCRPASAALRNRRRMKRAMLAQRNAAPGLAPPEGPVPPREGDRPSAGNSYAADVAEYGRHMAANRVRDAHFIAWAMGSNLPSLEFPRAVASYRKANLAEGADTMLSTAANRDMQTSVNIAAALLDVGQLMDAQRLLTAIRTDV
ncbi:helix-turn-helix domain-containing protein [Streptomyces sp. NPDC002853]